MHSCPMVPDWPDGYTDPLFVREAIDALLEQPGHAYWMVTQKLKDGSEMEAGHVLARVAGGEFADILSLYVRPELRRMGHAQLLMAQVLTAAHKAGCHGLTLEVRAGNTAARGLYEGCGMTEAHTRKSYYDDGEDAVVYTLELPH